MYRHYFPDELDTDLHLHVVCFGEFNWHYITLFQVFSGQLP